MTTSFTDCCIRYGQAFVYMRFSEGNMLLGDIYMALIHGLIDPTCLPPMAIVRYDNKIWCTDTRRLTLAKELERQRKWDVLEFMRIREVKHDTPEYKDFVTQRIPAMHRKGLDGLTIQVSDRRGPTCCFGNDSKFRVDFEEHIIQDHLLNSITLEEFKALTIYHCDMCHKTTQITCTKSAKRSHYTIIRKCGCKPKNHHEFAQPWSTITLGEMCAELRHYKGSKKRKLAPRKPRIVLPSSRTLLEPDRLVDFAHNDNQLQSWSTNNLMERDYTNRTTCLLAATSSPIMKKSIATSTSELNENKLVLKTSETQTATQVLVHAMRSTHCYSETKPRIDTREKVTKSCCNIS